MIPTLFAKIAEDNKPIERPPPAPGYSLPVPKCYPAKGDVLLFSDKECTSFVCCVPSHYSNAPKRNRTKKYTIDCHPVRIQWV